jgi:hypothetical protein
MPTRNFACCFSLEEITMHRKVLCPVEKPGGKTVWLRSGNAFDNKDGSINIYLDVLPSNGRLQIREFDDRDRPADDGPPPADDPLPF